MNKVAKIAELEHRIERLQETIKLNDRMAAKLRERARSYRSGGYLSRMQAANNEARAIKGENDDLQHKVWQAMNELDSLKHPPKPVGIDLARAVARQLRLTTVKQRQFQYNNGDVDGAPDNIGPLYTHVGPLGGVSGSYKFVLDGNQMVVHVYNLGLVEGTLVTGYDETTDEQY